MSTATKTASDTQTVATYRVVADVIERWLASAGSLLLVIQIAFAAYGFWVTAHSLNQDEGMAAFEPHAINGMVLSWLSVLLFVLGVVSRANIKAWLLPAIAAVLLFFAQGPLVGLGFGVSVWFGALHAFVGTCILLGYGWLTIDRWVRPLGR